MGSKERKEAACDLANTAEGLPERCKKSEFARLLGVDPACVSRWVSWKRVELDDSGRVLVRPSLTRLLLTTDPVRGGRGLVRGVGSGGTIDRARALLERSGAPQTAPADRVAYLEHQLVEARAQLAEARAQLEHRYTQDQEASLRFELQEAMKEQWPALTAALAAGGDAFERIMFRIECRIYMGATEDEIAEDEPLFFGGPTKWPTPGPAPAGAPALDPAAPCSSWPAPADAPALDPAAPRST